MGTVGDGTERSLPRYALAGMVAFNERAGIQTDTRMTIELVLPMPPEELSPNYRSQSPWPKIRALAAYREEVGWEAIAQSPVPRHTLKPPVTATLTFAYKVKRARDEEQATDDQRCRPLLFLAPGTFCGNRHGRPISTESSQGVPDVDQFRLR